MSPEEDVPAQSVLTPPKVTLHWQGPFTLPKFLQSVEYTNEFKGKSGVYLWTEPDDVGKVLTYVGCASGKPCLWIRQFQHYMNLIGGQYNIPAEFRHDKQQWGLKYENEICKRVVFDLEQFKMLAADAFAYVERTRIFVCPWPAAEVETIERNLLWDLQPRDTTWGTRTPPSMRLDISHQNALWASLEIRRQIHPDVQII